LEDPEVATLTIRDLDESLKLSLRIRAAERNRSMEEEARQILRAALEARPATGSGLGQRIRERFAAFGDVQLATPARETVRPAPAFGAGQAGVAAVKVRAVRRKKPAA
jgi:plasmid stability protein